MMIAGPFYDSQIGGKVQAHLSITAKDGHA
jgi:hypothetical protein